MENAETKPIRNLTTLRTFNIYKPDISPEQAKANLPWVMRVPVPHDYCIRDTVVIEGPIVSPLIPPSKTTAYVIEMAKAEPQEVIYITSVFPGMPVPWPNHITGLEEGDLICSYISTTSHNGIPLVHIAMNIYTQDYFKASKEFEEGIKDKYLIIEPKEYDLHKGMLAMAAAHRMNERRE